MKERPILFSGAMVRALLAGTKTQTRRVMKPQPTGFVGGPGVQLRNGSPAPLVPIDEDAGPYGREIRCPYGQPGDRLWVRESWAEVPRHEPQTDEDLPYREDGRIVVYAADPHWEGSRQFLCADGVLRWARPERWRPSIHMPRWASRITLQIASVRVERLQEISIEDAKAEGAWGPDDSIVQKVADYFGTDIFSANPRKAFQMLWESINGPDSWAANPWVWAVEFKRLEATA